MSPPLLVSTGDAVGRLTLNDPPLNILTRDLLAAIRTALAELGSDDSLGVLVLTAAGENFSAGADVKEHLPPRHSELIPEFIETIQALDRFPVPLLAAVRGRCLGGGFELVQAADIILAGESAEFGQPEIRLGVIAPAACALLPRFGLGPAADEMLFTGDSISSDRAKRLGLVLSVAPDEGLEAAVQSLASRIARNSPAALRLAKRAMREGSAATRAEAMESAGRLYLEEVMATRDALEGLQAFVERRAPRWVGR